MVKGKVFFSGIITLCIIFIVILTAGCNDNDTASLITNPGFEDGSTGWTLGTNAVISSSNAHSGSGCLSLSPEDGDASTAEQEFTVDSGTSYNFTFWRRRLEDSGATYGSLRTIIYFYDSESSQLSSSGGIGEVPTTYSLSTGGGSLPAGTSSVKIVFVNYVTGLSDDTIVIDDLAFTVE